jgi:hypothetical protein
MEEEREGAGTNMRVSVPIPFNLFFKLNGKFSILKVISNENPALFFFSSIV